MPGPAAAAFPWLGKLLWGGVKIGGTIAAWEYIKGQLGLDPTTPPPADENELAQFAQENAEALNRLQNDPQIQQAQQQGQQAQQPQQGPRRDPNSLQGQANQLIAEASQVPSSVKRMGGGGGSIPYRPHWDRMAQAQDKIRKAGIQDRNDSRDFDRASVFWDNPQMGNRYGIGALASGQGWEDLDEQSKRRFSDWIKAGRPQNMVPKFDAPAVATTPAPVTPTATATPTTNPADPADPNAPPDPGNIPDLPVDNTSADRGSQDTTSNAYANEATGGDTFNWFNDREFQDPKVLKEALEHAKTLPVEKRKPFIDQLRSKFEQQKKKELDESNSDIPDAIDGGWYDKTVQWFNDKDRWFNTGGEDTARRRRERWDAETKSDIDKRNNEINGKFAQIEAHIKEAEQGGALYEEAPSGNPGPTGQTGPAAPVPGRDRGFDAAEEEARANLPASSRADTLPPPDPFDEPQVKTGTMGGAYEASASEFGPTWENPMATNEKPSREDHDAVQEMREASGAPRPSLPHEQYVAPGEQLPGMEGVDDLPELPELDTMAGVGNTGDYKVPDTNNPENLHLDPEDRSEFRSKTWSERAKEKEMDEAWANRNNAPAEPEISPEMEEAWANRTAPDPFDGVDDLPELPELDTMANVENPDDFRPAEEALPEKRWTDSQSPGNRYDPWKEEIAPYRSLDKYKDETWSDYQARKDRNSELRFNKQQDLMTPKDQEWMAKNEARPRWTDARGREGNSDEMSPLPSVDTPDNPLAPPEPPEPPVSSGPNLSLGRDEAQPAPAQPAPVAQKPSLDNPAPAKKHKPHARMTFIGNDGKGGQHKEAISWTVPGASADLQRRIDEANLQSYMRQNKAKIDAASKARRRRLASKDAVDQGISSDGIFRPSGPTMANNTVQRPKGATDFDQPTIQRIGEDPKKKKNLKGRHLATPWA